MDNPFHYTVPLALYDYIPVILSGIGGYLLVRVAASRVPAVWTPGIIGVILAVTGGASKATWKLVIAAPPDAPIVLRQVLFPLLAGGFVLLAWALWSGLKDRVLPWWPTAVVLALAWIAADAVRGMKPFFIVAVSASLLVTILAIVWAVRTKDPAAVVAFAVQLAGVFALVPLQRAAETLSTQWLEETVNILAQGAYAFGAWRVWRKVRTSSEAVLEGI